MWIHFKVISIVRVVSAERFCSEILISVLPGVVFQEVTEVTDTWKALIFSLEGEIFLLLFLGIPFP